VLAASGEEALRHVLDKDFAVILLDAKMQGVDGFTTAKMIRARERSRHTPIIFLTACLRGPGVDVQGYEAGAVDYIVKPVIPNVLKSKIAVFVGLYQMTDALKREIAERKKVAVYLRTSKQNLRALAARQQSIREEESIRIAREIHDELGQSLTALKMTLTWIVARLPADQKAFTGKIDLMFKMIDGTIQTVRKISAGLRPEVLDQLGPGRRMQLAGARLPDAHRHPLPRRAERAART
jgi:DNA-binding response OmpR family regulator